MTADHTVIDADTLPSGGGDERRRRGGGVLSAAALVALVVSAAVGGNLFGSRDRLFGDDRGALAPAISREQSDADRAAAAEASDPTRLRSQPWWQKVTVLRGSGPGRTAAFDVEAGALQWRVKPTCKDGRLEVSEVGRKRPLLEAACPAEPDAVGYATRTGSFRLEVEADGDWELLVEQQVDVPLEEPPLPEMTAPGAAVVAAGDFYRIDQTGTGRATLYRLEDGTHALRFAGFYVTPNVDLEIRLSPLPGPQTTPEFVGTPSALVAKLDVTAGSLNFRVPPEIDPAQYRSVVIWCEQLHTAYAGIRLEPAR